MTRRKHPRLWTPATTLLAGTGIALAFGISKSWPVAILAEVVTLCVAGSLYFVGGQDTGIGAVIGQQDDERQQLVALRAARLALVVVFFAVIAACVIAAAAKHAFWPFELLAVIAGISYFIRPAGGPGAAPPSGNGSIRRPGRLRSSERRSLVPELAIS